MDNINAEFNTSNKYLLRLWLAQFDADKDNLEFATQNGFANVVVHPFYMTDSDYRTANPLVEGIETCYGDGGRQNHYLNDDNPTVSDSYYLTPEVIALSNYSHIHEHSHEDE